MDDHTDLGYVELQHTADWAARVWAPDYPALLVQAAKAMYEMSGIVLLEDQDSARVIDLAADDEESLLVAFLNELLFLQETENLAFTAIELNLLGLKLQAQLQGGKIKDQSKEIKAVTYHNLQIERTSGGLETTIVFDV